MSQNAALWIAGVLAAVTSCSCYLIGSHVDDATRWHRERPPGVRWTPVPGPLVWLDEGGGFELDVPPKGATLLVVGLPCGVRIPGRPGAGCFIPPERVDDVQVLVTDAAGVRWRASWVRDVVGGVP